MSRWRYTVAIFTDSAIICFYLRVSRCEDPCPVASMSNKYTAPISNWISNRTCIWRAAGKNLNYLNQVNRCMSHSVDNGLVSR